MSRLKIRWNQPDQFDWITTFLRQRGLLRSAQLIMAVVASSSSLVPLSVLVTHHHSPTRAVLVSTVLAAYTLGLTVFWLRRWPTCRQSQTILVIGALGIAAWSLAQPNAAIAALSCTALAATGGYIAFFHNLRILVFNVVVAVAIAATATLRLASQTNLATGAAAFWLIWFLNMSMPLAIWGMSRAMRTYAQRSDNDSLTGLLNRRAFTDAVTRRLADPLPTHTRLAVMMVDLDNFKAINDTHGHPAGDRVLRAVAARLRDHTPPRAAICRAGGEEFLIALTSATADMAQLAARLCTAIAKLPHQVTASIGTATADLHHVGGPDLAAFVEELITSADGAMYAAKRDGGNQAQHA